MNHSGNDHGPDSSAGASEHPAERLARFVAREVDNMLRHQLAGGNGCAALGMVRARPEQNE